MLSRPPRWRTRSSSTLRSKQLFVSRLADSSRIEDTKSPCTWHSKAFGSIVPELDLWKITTIFAPFTPFHPITPQSIPFPPHPLRRDERGSSYEDAPHIAIASHADYEMEGSFLTFGDSSEVDRHFPIEYTCTSPHTLKISEEKKKTNKSNDEYA